MALDPLDLSPQAIEAAPAKIDQAFRNTPQFVAEGLSDALAREVVVKVETLNPIGSFKGRGTSLLAQTLDPTSTWVCATAGNFGQGLAYAARRYRTGVDVFVSPDVPELKLNRMRALGARVEVTDQPEAAARAHALAREQRQLVVDGLAPTMAEGAGTIGLELGSIGPLDTLVVQVGDGALASGVGCWFKATSPQTRIVGICASGAPAMAHSFAERRPRSVAGKGTIATALAITEPVPASLARVVAFVDDILLVDDDDLRAAVDMITASLGVIVEPAGAAGVAALMRYGNKLPGNRAAVILTGSGV